MYNEVKHLLLTMMLGLVLTAQAEITFEVVGVGNQQFSVATSAFVNEDNNKSITSIIRADLARTGLFHLIDTTAIALSATPSEIPYPLIKATGAQTQLIGQVMTTAQGYLVRFWFVDLLKQTVLFAYEKPCTTHSMRHLAHEIADLIYYELTKQKGIFATQIAFVSRQAKQYQLQVADADGFNAKTIVASNEPIISPKFAPNGRSLAYVSFERKKPIIFVQYLDSGERYAVAEFKGNNSAPAWSPDGSQLAIVLTQSGTAQIYLIGVRGDGLRRLTYSQAIDTEPSFSPDGKSILFTSDRGGSPQIYHMSIQGGTATRLTYDGRYNASAKFSPDGQSIVLIHRKQGKYQVALMDMATRQIIPLSDTTRDDSPSFAPNGQMILYETQLNGQGALATVSIDARVKQRLKTSGDIRQPIWGK